MNIAELRKMLQGESAAGKTDAVMKAFNGNPDFQEMSREEARLLRQRDREDDEKLIRGIEYSISQGTLEPRLDAGWDTIDVAGKTPDEVVAEITSHLPDGVSGCTLAVCGESGVGKGTTVQELATKFPGAIQWSNGDVFRIFTYLFLNDELLRIEDPSSLNGEILSEARQRITVDGNSIRFTVNGTEYFLGDVKNTLLKTADVNRSVPTYAEFLQGEVILIANRYIKANSRQLVLVEGRKVTLNYIDATWNFELVHHDSVLLGRRRAAQKLVSLLEESELQDGDIEVLLSLYK